MTDKNVTLHSEWINLLANKKLCGKALEKNAVIVYSHNLERIIWTNFSGARLFGGGSISGFMVMEPDPDHPFLRQLASVVMQLGKEPIHRALRVVNKTRSHLLQCEIDWIDLNHAGMKKEDKKAVIVTCTNPTVEELKETEFMQMVFDGFAEFGSARAICDEFGRSLYITDTFSEIGFLPDAMEEAYAKARNKTGISVNVKTTHNGNVPIRLCLLTDAPRRLLAIVDDGYWKSMQIEMTPHQTDNRRTTNAPIRIISESGQPPGQLHSDKKVKNKFLDNREHRKNSLQNNDILRDQHKGDLQYKKDATPLSDKPNSLPLENGNRNNTDTETPPSNGEDAISLEEGSRNCDPKETFVFNPEHETIRFTWNTDINQIFTSLSPELACAIGPNAADIVGRKWSSVAAVFGFDRNREIHSLLKKQDTWSGKSVLWPVQATSLQVPIDLAALPSFSSRRRFEGFRGFGIIRISEAMEDPDECGLALAPGQQIRAENSSAAQSEKISDDQRELVTMDDRTAETHDVRANGNIANAIIRSGKRQQDSSDQPCSDKQNSKKLSKGENRAFRKIGRKLRDTPESESPHLERYDDNGKKERNTVIDEVDIGHDAVEKAPVNDVPKMPVDTSLLEKLPVPTLVYRNNNILFANREFLTFTGYADFAELRDTGGVDRLFTKENSGNVRDGSEVILSDKDGKQIKIRAFIHNVPWDARRASLLSFRQPGKKSFPENEKIALDTMRMSELQNILDTATDGIIILNHRGMVQSVNQPAEALFGRSNENVSKKPVYELFADESHKNIDQALANTGSSNSEKILNNGCDVIGIEAKGNLMPLYITIGKIGASNRYCMILRDMTSWKKTRKELIDAKKQAEDASDQKTEFLARVSHEIRTPLNAIIGFSDVMIEERFGPVGNDRYREYLCDINRSGVHVLDLINDLLDISKIEAGKMEMSFEAVNLNGVVSQTVALLQPQANGNRVIIRTSLSRAVPRVVADVRSIRQIILNLVSNGIKFTGTNGQVIVSTVYEENGEVALRVRDTGRGMSNEEVGIALKPFGQVAEISEISRQGTGLGLPLTKALVEANKAYLDIESKPAKGTIVHIKFPSQRVLTD